MSFFKLETRQPIINPDDESDDILIQDEAEPADKANPVSQFVDSISNSNILKKISKSLHKDYFSNKEQKIYYNPSEFATFLNNLSEQNEKEGTVKSRATKEIIISTVGSVFEFAKASFKENHQPNKKEWDTNSKISASCAASHMIALVQTLGNNPEKLQQFWEKIYKPLALSGGSSDGEIDIFTSGFMNELACGLALKKQLGDSYEVLRGTPKEDVENGKDLIVKNITTNNEKSIQLKLLRGGARELFVDIEKRLNPIEVKVYYGRTPDEAFNPVTGEPTDKLMTEIKKALLNEVK